MSRNNGDSHVAEYLADISKKGTLTEKGVKFSWEEEYSNIHQDVSYEDILPAIPKAIQMLKDDNTFLSKLPFNKVSKRMKNLEKLGRKAQSTIRMSVRQDKPTLADSNNSLKESLEGALKIDKVKKAPPDFVTACKKLQRSHGLDVTGGFFNFQ